MEWSEERGAKQQQSTSSIIIIITYYTFSCLNLIYLPINQSIN